MRRKVYFYAGADILGFTFINYYKDGVLSPRTVNKIMNLKKMFESVSGQEVDKIKFFDFKEEIWYILSDINGEKKFIKM